MSQMHGSDLLMRWCLFQDSIAGFLMNAGFEEVLEFREHLIHIGGQLDLAAGALLDQIHPVSTQVFQLQVGNILQLNKSMWLVHQDPSDNECINTVSLGLADVVSPHGGRLDRIDQANLEAS